MDRQRISQQSITAMRALWGPAVLQGVANGSSDSLTWDEATFELTGSFSELDQLVNRITAAFQVTGTSWWEADPDHYVITFFNEIPNKG